MDTNNKRERRQDLIQQMTSRGDVINVLRHSQTANNLRCISVMVLAAGRI